MKGGGPPPAEVPPSPTEDEEDSPSPTTVVSVNVDDGAWVYLLSHGLVGSYVGWIREIAKMVSEKSHCWIKLSALTSFVVPSFGAAVIGSEVGAPVVGSCVGLTVFSCAAVTGALVGQGHS